MSTRNSVTKQSSRESSTKNAMKINVPRKRLPLIDVTNQRSGSQNVTRTSVSSSKFMVPCAAKSLKMKDPSDGTLGKMDSENVLPSSLILESNKLISLKNNLESDQSIEIVTVSPHEVTFMGASNSVHISTSLGMSPRRSVTDSTSLVENMSTRGSLKSPGFEDSDDENSLSVTSLERKTSTTTSLRVSANSATSENICKEDVLVDIGTFDEIVDVDKNLIDSQLCPFVAWDIYDYLHASEMHNRPCTYYLETIQKDINASMRSIIIDWLVEVAEEYNLVPDTLFLAVNYIDRYLSGNSVKRRHLQLLGVACMLVAAKYEEISPPSVEEFCYITDYTYFREQVLRMEFSVLSYLKFELSVPTTICFLRKFIFVAQKTCEVPLIQFMCLANFLAELSLPEYNMLSYAPSLIAASATFLAKFILIPSKAPWNCTLRHHTSYKASDLRECVMAIHSLCCTGNTSSELHAVRKKYSQHKYEFVAKKYCPSSIPSTFFLDEGKVPCVTKISKAKKRSPVRNGIAGLPGNSMVNVKSTSVAPLKSTTLLKSEEIVPPSAVILPPSSMDVSPSKSDGVSVSLDETMSTSDSFKSPEVEYVDNNDVSMVDSIERKTFSILHISDHNVESKGRNICSRDMLVDLERDEKFVDVDNDYEDPQKCATIACDIYMHLRASEAKKRPSTDFMERIQKDINANMRAILVDWLVEVAEEYRLVPDTLYLTVNYIDRYLSGNAMDRQRLQLLGVASMMIASKYEEICAPQVEEFCYITDNTYFKEEVLQMESSVLNYLKFEMTAPTIKCFLRRFVRVAQGIDEIPAMQMECLANYLAELSLIEYNMIVYSPSLVAASAIFLAKFILFSTKRPWNSTLQHYTLYQPCDLRDCVKDLHKLCCNSPTSTLPAIREKYSQHKYKQVAKKHCPPIIPPEFFYNQTH